MGSCSYKHKGQALVEAAVILVVLILFVGMSAKIAFVILKNFKHQHLENDRPLTRKDLPFDLKWAKDLVLFKEKNIGKVEDEFKQKGWKLKNKIKTDSEILLLMEKDNNQLLLNNEMGVRLCTANCLRE
jgi:hypothetical protein